MSGDNKDNLIKITGGGEPDAFRDAVRGIKKNMPDFIEWMKVDAELRRVKYDALLKEGFSKTQALELAKGVLIPTS